MNRENTAVTTGSIGDDDYSANRKSVDVEHLVELNLLSRKMQNYQSVWLLNHQAHGSDRPSSEQIFQEDTALENQEDIATVRDQSHGFDKPPPDESEQTLQATGPEANKKKKKQPKA
nr:hypothetical protein [Tanacetum cinerariifolium]